ncbi:histidine phosphatase family protein [Sanguibacter antarcticus]|uniref:Putative phosphoglycerate mutase n=1 Tax=Sanguibacter antarcticus TaxID=372484 RepID=A0A2A9E2C7_9MICO|nr:histidine phosphatase family protein [Sanguibacter antarcticus]PFG33197.1 putative phosphoglycerate mutase [Sanguibacter antarcticus]
MKLHLVRHGRTASNVTGAIDTSVPGPPLDDVGAQQAVALARALGDVPFDRVVASSQLRAQMTAAALAQERGIELDVRDGLREVSAGALEMRADEEAVGQYLGLLAAWGRGDADHVLPGGETQATTLDRFDAVVEELVGAGSRHAAIVSHGAIIRVWCAARVSNLDVGFIMKQNLTNTGIVTVERDAHGRWVADRWESAVVPAPVAEGDLTGQPVG